MPDLFRHEAFLSGAGKKEAGPRNKSGVTISKFGVTIGV
jgi:hypothetical protein